MCRVGGCPACGERMAGEATACDCRVRPQWRPKSSLRDSAAYSSTWKVGYPDSRRFATPECACRRMVAQGAAMGQPNRIGSDQRRLLDYPATRAVDYLDNRAARGARVCRVSSVPCRAGRTAGAGHGPRNRVPAGGVSQAAAHAPARRLLAQLPSGPRRHSGVLLAGAETSP